MSFESQSASNSPSLEIPAVGTDQDDTRVRLLEGIAQAVAEKGYAATTIADIVAAARVSKRTFYQHFSGKEACFSTLYITASARALNVLRDALQDNLPWQAQVERAISAYMETLAANPARARALYIEVLRMGAPGLKLRRASHERFAAWIVEVVTASRVVDEAEHRMALSLARAVVGAINELVLQAIERDPAEGLLQIVGPASRLVRAVFDHGVSTQS